MHRRLKEGVQNPVPSLFYHGMNLRRFILDSTLIYFIFYILLSYLAKFRDVKILYVFSLLDIIVNIV